MDTRTMQTLANQRDERNSLPVIARSACDEAIQLFAWRTGLLPPSLFELRRTQSLRWQ